MSFRQTHKGIFQFQDQSALERAMFEIQAEAMGADALGLQESYHSPGVMLLNIDVTASVQDWEEMAVAIATLAMHAGRGFCYSTAFDGGETGPRVEYYTASGPYQTPRADFAAPPHSEDYFPLREGSRQVFEVKGLSGWTEMEWNVRKVEVGSKPYYYFETGENFKIHYNEFWDGIYFHKHGPFLDAVLAGSDRELSGMLPGDRYSMQQAYSSLAKRGDVSFAIWTDGDHFLEFTVEGFEDIELPVGRMLDCMKVRMELYHVMGSEMYRETQYQYFAKGHGLVHWKKRGASLSLKNG